MQRETGNDRVWVDPGGVTCDVAGTRLDSDWGCGLAEFATRTDLREHIARTHGDAVLAEVDAAVAAELAAQVPGSPEEAARLRRDQQLGARLLAEWLSWDQRVHFSSRLGDMPVTEDEARVIEMIDRLVPAAVRVADAQGTAAGST